MKQGVRYFIVLLVICSAAAALLATVYVVTKEPIARSRVEKTMTAVQTVLPPSDNVVVDPEKVKLLVEARSVLPPADQVVIEGQEVCEMLGPDAPKPLPDIYPAFKDKKLVGAAIKVTDPNGYGGNVELMVGITVDGRVYAVSILQHKETPGLGSKIGDSAFSDQFKELEVPSGGLKVRKDGGTIQAITGATISSRAVTHGVNEAVRLFRELAPRLTSATAPGGKDG